MVEAIVGVNTAPSNVEDVARRLDIAETLFRRWIGAWVDFVVLGVVFLAAVFMFEDRFVGTKLVIVGLFWLAYFPVTEGLWGRTLGKLVTGSVVVNAQGQPPGLGRAAIRTLLRLVEVNPFLLGGLPAAILVMASPHRQRLGDMAAGTYVIPTKSLVRNPGPTVADAFS